MFRRGFLHICAIAFLGIAALFSGCTRHHTPDSHTVAHQDRIQTLNYTIQAGAFAVQENALAFTDQLRNQGIDAFSFIAEDKLYKVRFGNFKTRDEALALAKKLQNQGIIKEYYIVNPEFDSDQPSINDIPELRRNLVRTANRFLGSPYRYGGESEDGFDCSGLVMTVYRLNGLNLPRVSRDQFNAGRRVALSQLQAGDLVFFRTGSGSAVTHVGLYIGKNQFIHAPGRGKQVKIAQLSNRYFADRYAGGRCYLD